jgi:copper chaperone CopZ
MGTSPSWDQGTRRDRGVPERRNARAPGRTVVVAVPPGLCRRCVRAISRRLRDVPGVVTFQIDAERGVVTIGGNPDPDDLRSALA